MLLISEWQSSDAIGQTVWTVALTGIQQYRANQQAWDQWMGWGRKTGSVTN